MRPDLLARLRASTARKENGVVVSPRRPCVHLGGATGEMTLCEGCGGTKTKFKVHACAVFGRCLPYSRAVNIASCQGCASYLPQAPV